jgi:hypothetical protein
VRSFPLVLSVFWLVGCASDPSPPRLDARLTECGLISEGHVGPSIHARFYMPTDCYRECLGEASCEDLEALLCRSSITLLTRCDRECAYRCADGSLIGIEDVCDGRQECRDGEDEMGCANCASGRDGADCVTPVFHCLDPFGAEYSGSWILCDNTTHCADGSDEANCVAHRCADGSMIRVRPDADVRCDSRLHCADGSDETDCAALIPVCEG